MQLMDGKSVAKLATIALKERVKILKFKPKLAIVQVGDNLSSNKYIKFKIAKGNELGLQVEHFKFDNNISTNVLYKKIKSLNSSFQGIIVQLPLPSHLDKQKVCDAIDYKNDVDGLTTKNNHLFYNDKKCFIPATALAIMTLIDYYNIDISCLKCGVVGQSDLVGKPISHLLEKRGALVNRYDLSTGIDNLNVNDLVIVAAGKANLVSVENLKQNSIVIDVGTNADNSQKNKIVGDVKIDDIEQKVKWFSPVPGGVGPLTVISLFDNLINQKE